MDCSGLYDGFKDLNEYLTKTRRTNEDRKEYKKRIWAGR